MTSIMLLGLDNDLAEPLGKVLRGLGYEVRATSSMAAALRDTDAQILFIDGDGPRYRETFRELSEKRPDLAAVIVNRFPEDKRWIDALELGAADYCGAPFEATQMRWIVDGAIRGRTGRPFRGSVAA